MLCPELAYARGYQLFPKRQQLGMNNRVSISSPASDTPLLLDNAMELSKLSNRRRLGIACNYSTADHTGAASVRSVWCMMRAYGCLPSIEISPYWVGGASVPPQRQMSIENPQLEDGHLKLVNSVAETLAHTQLSGYEWRVLLFLLRKTYGWSKKSDIISLSQFEDGTGLDRRHVARTIKRLIKKRIILTTPSANLGTSKLSTYTFNKHFGEWRPSAHLGTTSANLGPLPSANLGTHNNNLYNSNTDKDLKNCAEEEKNGAPLFENPNFLIPEEPETKPDKAIQATTSVPYLLASWFYAFRNVPVRPIPADMHYAKLLLQFYSESVIKKGIEWRLSSDPDGYWATHITIAAVYRQFGNWMAESSVKAISLRQWIQTNPDMDFARFTDPLARADGFMRAFNEAKRNKSVYFEDADYAMYKKAIRIKTAESKAETKEMMDGRNR